MIKSKKREKLINKRLKKNKKIIVRIFVDKTVLLLYNESVRNRERNKRSDVYGK